VRVAFAGTPAFAVPALLALLGSHHKVVGVLSQPDRPKGRGRALAASPVKEAARAADVPVSQPATLKSESDRSALISWAPDVLVVAAYGLLLPRPVLELPRLGCVNIHPSLLPRWRGAAPIQRTVLAGDAETGVTIMQMDAGLDTGPVLLERVIRMEPSETAGSLQERLAHLGAEALLEALEGLATGSLASQPQAAEGVSYAAKIQKSEARIDWGRPAEEIERQVRAFNPWPIAETRFKGEQLRIFAAQIAAGAGQAGPGTVVEVASGSIVVQCGRGRLGLLQVQRPGRKVVAATDLIHSVPLLGERLG
jgi:methionyl-tRNA formyltransferase